jgi:hypothetical protein
MTRPYHIQYPEYNQRMKAIKAHVLIWYSVFEERELFTLVPMSSVPQRIKEMP